MKRTLLFTLMFLFAMLAKAQQPDFHAGFHNVIPAVEPDFKDVNYAGDDLEAHRLDIYLPKTGQKSYKAVIAIYGSAWFSNNMKAITYFSLGKPLIDAGFAVICINHRASTDAKFPAQIQDVKGVIRFIRANKEKFKIDDSFIGITGFSSGGHLSAMAGVTNGMKTFKGVDIEGNVGGNENFSSRVDAVVDWFGPVDMAHMENCTEPKDDKSPEAVLIGGDPRVMTDMVKVISPVYYMKNKKNMPQFVVIHGDADDVVPYCQSKTLSEALQKIGKLTEFVTVPNGKHGPVTFNEQTYKTMVDFFKKF
ncbi:MAG: prolyl oligopeptidase family serine peptidase [Bacteroidales bacterium]|nr:prolyl oligopeptidase family serine peptidase [Bacteroidales bacterium]